MEFPKSIQVDEKDSMDSLTLSQLKSMVGSPPKVKQTMFDYRYDDEDTVSNEIEEFYSYIEVSQVEENLRAWQGSFSGEWMKSPFAQRKSHVEVLLEGLEHRDAEVRFGAARRLLYVLQGTFAESTSPEHQLHCIIENCKVVRAANGTSTIIEALKVASAKHDLLSSLSEMDTRHFNISAAEKQDFIDEVNTELSVYFGQLYFLIEIFKGDEEFAEELMIMDPPLPVYLFSLVASLKEKSAKGYPVKKLLLVLWKTLLTCLGGTKDINRTKRLARELSGLPPMRDGADTIKSSPSEFYMFRQETTIKYPTFNPQPTDDLPADKLATALSVIPLRHHYHHPDDDSLQGPQRFPQSQQASQQMQAATPMPTPPQSPKPKKQQYQTDQQRPFLFPYSRVKGSRRLVPFAIDEAEGLYSKHMHISLQVYQMWRTREDCMLEESGLHSMPRSDSDQLGPGSSILSDRKFSIVSVPSMLLRDTAGRPLTSDEDEQSEHALPDLVLLDNALKETEATLARAEATGATRSERRKLNDRREDLVRLKRVEILYRAVLPQLQGWVIVLLKLLLATVTANSANPPSANPSQFPSVNDPPLGPPPTVEEIDVMRHREITSKAVSAILILTLKWFKTSHVMKFHHLGQLLLDSNCLLLILKMFGLQEVSTTVVAKNEVPDQNFFRYCYLNFSKNAQNLPPEDHMLNAPRMASRPSMGDPDNEDEVELISDYSWRNFFASINFVKVMQKLSKHRSHRIWLLVQYKSSAILKRILKVSHPMLQLQVLKLVKSQVPFCGRKWRQSNMKVITSIYLNCRPDLRDEWLTGTEVEDVSDALSQEQALRSLVKFYNSKRYGAAASSSLNTAHRRSSSQSLPQIDGLQAGPELANLNRAGPSPKLDADVFPPLRSRAQDPTIFLPYTGEDIAFEDEYEDYLSDLGQEDHVHLENLGFSLPGDSDVRGTSAWHRLSKYPTDITDAISDSESVVSIGDLGDGRGGDGSVSDDSSSVDENTNNWEHLSPKTFQQMPKSPASGGRRRSSEGGLRPVLPFGLDDGSAVDDDDYEGPEMGPMPTYRNAPFAAGEGGRGIDEVEYLYQE